MLLCLVLTAFTSVSAGQDGHHDGTPSLDIPAFVDRLDSLRKAGNIPGLSVAVVKDQAIVFALGLGYADVITTVLDLAKFDVALDQGVLISAESREAMMAPTRSRNGDTLPYGLGWYVQEYQGHTLIWHSGWWEDAYSALYLKIPALGLSFIVLANSEGIWWDNPLDQAEVKRSEFAQAFLRAFVDDQWL